MRQTINASVIAEVKCMNSENNNNIELLDTTSPEENSNTLSSGQQVLPTLDSSLQDNTIPVPQEPSTLSSQAHLGENKQSLDDYNHPTPRVPVSSTLAQPSSTNLKPTPPKTSQTMPESEGGALGSSSGDSTAGKPRNPLVMVIVFVVLLVAIFLLPYTGSLFENLFSKKDTSSANEITSGKLVCVLENDADKMSYHYTETYEFEDRGVKTLQHVVLIQGNADKLKMRNAQCQQLSKLASTLSGVTVNCNLSSDEMVETQFFDFSSVKEKQMSSAFIEAGGIYPNIKYGDDIGKVEDNLTLSGYECDIS